MTIGTRARMTFVLAILLHFDLVQIHFDGVRRKDVLVQIVFEIDWEKIKKNLRCLFESALYIAEHRHRLR